MDLTSLSAINGLESVSRYDKLQTIQENAEQSGKTGTASFDSLLSSAMKMVQETEDYSNAAEEEEIKYATGQSTSMHDLIAQQKANVSLQYTVAVKNTAVEAYKSIMNMQF